MNFPREKRLLLGWLALLAPLPLPFNEVLGWGWYLLFALGVGAFLVRARRDEERWMPNWASNTLALVYLPFLAFDLVALSGGRIAGPVLRLGLFAILLKLYALRRERDKWQAVMAIFFVFLAAAATSVHLSVVLYLMGFLVLVMLLLVRFAFFHLLSGFGRRQAEGLEVPLGGFLAVSALLSLLVAIPLFALLPRVHNPYLGGNARMSMGSEVRVAGMSDEVTLDSIGSIRTSREVALRLTYEGMAVPREIRLRAGTFDLLEGRSWQRAGEWQQIGGGSSRRIDLVAGDDGDAVGEVGIWLQPLGAKGVPVPVEATMLEMPRRSLRLDRGGALRLVSPLNAPMEYTALLRTEPVSVAPPPAPDAAAPTLDLAGVSPRMEALAAEVMGEGTELERARRLESFLTGGEFRYTLDLVGDSGAEPLEDFLFEHRSGHCEYFASAMVLLLRSQGIHARLAAGFLGGEPNPLGYVVVRQSNAHAWVEAWVPGEGWTIFDPTPPAGRPGLEATSFLDMASQFYDSLVFQWDRHVLSYGVEDQVGFLYGFLMRAWRAAEGMFGEDPAEPAPPTARDAPEAPPLLAPQGGDQTLPTAWEKHLLTGVLVLLALLLGYRLWRAYHDNLTATRAYRELRRLFVRGGLTLNDATGPLALHRQAAARWPRTAPAVERVVGFYLRESFGRQPVGDDERPELRRALDDARRALREHPAASPGGPAERPQPVRAEASGSTPPGFAPDRLAIRPLEPGPVEPGRLESSRLESPRTESPRKEPR